MNNQPIKETTIIRTFDAPRKMVWKAWTDEKILQKWWGPKYFTNPVCEWNAIVGGTINVVMTAGQDEILGSFKGMKAPMGGNFIEVVPPEKLVFVTTALGENNAVMLQNRNTVIFEEITEKGATKTKMFLHVIVEVAKPGMEQALAGMNQGWNESFDKLVNLL